MFFSKSIHPLLFVSIDLIYTNIIDCHYKRRYIENFPLLNLKGNPKLEDTKFILGIKIFSPIFV